MIACAVRVMPMASCPTVKASIDKDMSAPVGAACLRFLEFVPSFPNAHDHCTCVAATWKNMPFSPLLIRRSGPVTDTILSVHKMG